MADTVGLSLDPPAHAVVQSIDEKSQIQAPDRNALLIHAPVRLEVVAQELVRAQVVDTPAEAGRQAVCYIPWRTSSAVVRRCCGMG
jgi:hypothetical protein